MGIRGKGSGGHGGGKWEKRGREVGVRGEGSGECLPPPCPPPPIWICFLSNAIFITKQGLIFYSNCLLLLDTI